MSEEKIDEKIDKPKVEWLVGTGTGNASCRVCGNVITKEQTNIKLCNARVNGQVHSNPFDCSEVRIDMLGLDDEKEGEVNE
tara:strand:+ start:1673 stop:1915 length:243 start_codon:yes stop_codon:yes gene_type:complete